jgi:hypothetical protein
VLEHGSAQRQQDLVLPDHCFADKQLHLYIMIIPVILTLVLNIHLQCSTVLDTLLPCK